MDMAVNGTSGTTRILMELRPALGGHAGIPQATRLLFRSLTTLPDVSVEGLLQSTEKVLTRGLPVKVSRFNHLSTDEQLNRLSRVIIAIEKDSTDRHVLATGRTILMALKHIVGGEQRLTRFDAARFQDFVWRRLFSRTLSHEDFIAVTHASYRIAGVPWFAMHICALVTRRLGYSLYPRIDTADFDVMIAETPYPATVSKSTTLVVRYHDAIPLLMPHTISDRGLHQAFHYRALRMNVDTGAHFVCVSNATREDLLSVFPQAESRTVTIHNIVSPEYFLEDSHIHHTTEIVRTRLNTNVMPVKRRLNANTSFESKTAGEAIPFILIVATIEPRKNHLGLLTAWERLRSEKFPTLQLIVVGALGWHHDMIIKRFAPWLERGDVSFLEDVLASELRILYRHARATVCPSFGEGFDYSGVESMKSGGAVVASDIPVHREIYGSGAEYFNPYAIDDMAHVIEQVITPSNKQRRARLVEDGARIAERYTQDAIVPVWQSFLASQSLAKV